MFSVVAILAAVGSLKQHSENRNVLEKPLGMGVMGAKAQTQPPIPTAHSGPCLPRRAGPPVSAEGSSALHLLFSLCFQSSQDADKPRVSQPCVSRSRSSRTSLLVPPAVPRGPGGTAQVISFPSCFSIQNKTGALECFSSLGVTASLPNCCDCHYGAAGAAAPRQPS